MKKLSLLFFLTLYFAVKLYAQPISGSSVFCVSSTTTYTHAVSGGTWSSSQPAVATIHPTTGVATGVFAGTTTITYVEGVNTITKTVTVGTSVPAMTGSTSTCLGTSVTLSHSYAGGTWSSSGVHVATINSTTGVVTPVAAGATFITYSLGSNCRTVRTLTVTPLPGVISGTMSMCQGGTTTLSSGTSGGTWASSNASVATINSSTGLVTGVSTGTSTITYTAATGCIRTAIVTVNAALGAITGSPIVCVGNTYATLVAPVSGGTWSSSNTSVVTTHPTTGLLTGIGAGNANITYTKSAGCKSTIEATVNTVDAITGASSMCNGLSITLANATGGGTWSSSNTSKATVGAGTGVVTGVAAGTSNISYIVSAGCFKTKPVTVNPLPSTINGTASVCTGNTTTLTNSTSGGTWSSSVPGVATIGTSGIVTGVSAGTTTISYVLGTGCLSTRIVTVNLMPNSITGTASLCAGSTTTLSSTTPAGVWTSYFTSVATVNSSTGVVTGLTGGITTITYTLGSCYRIQTVSVTAQPAAISGTLSMCVGNTSTLASATTAGVWSSSDVAIATVNATTGLVTGIDTGTSTISYTKSGCSRTAVVTVGIVAGITGTTTLCTGTTTTLANATAGGTWSSSNTAKATVGATTGVVTGVSGGTANITYRISSTCFQTTVVSVNPTPNTITGTASVCESATTTLATTTVGGAWSSGTPAVATIGTSGIVSGVSGGTSIISYTVDGCHSKRIVTVTAVPAPITGTLEFCVGNTSALASATAGGVWTSSDVTKASINATTGLTTGIGAGTSNISYTKSGCRATAVVSVSTIPAITGTASVCMGATTALSIATTGGAWSSGTPSVATIGTSGIVTSVSGGTSVISYTIGGCSSTRIVTVIVLPASITGSLTFCAGDTGTLASATTGGVWTSSDVTKATINATTGFTTGVAAGNSTISYTKTGCRVTAEVTVSSIAAITGTASVCVGSTTTLAHATGGGTWSSANAAKATVVSGTGVVTGVSSGTARISYVLGDGCYQTVIVTVNALPNNITGFDTVCEGSTTTFATTSTGGVWSSETPAVATVSVSGVITGVDAGTSVISYEFATGCVRTRTVMVNTTPDVITGPTSVCTGNTVTLASATGGGTWTSYFTSRATINSASGLATGLSAGTTIITYRLSTGCNRTAILTVQPTPASITGVLILCNGSTTPLSSATFSGAWTSTDITKATINPTTGLVTGTGVGTSTISYTVGSCSTVAEVTVNAGIAAITGSASLCVGNTSAELVAPVPGGTWSSTAPTIVTVHSTSGLLTGVSGGTATLTYTASSGCYTTIVASVNSVAVITGDSVMCAESGVTLSNATGGGTWSSSNVSKATVNSGTGVVTGVAGGTAYISYIVSTGCYKTKVVTVNPLPTSINGTAIACAGNTTSLTNATSGGTWSSSTAGVATIGTNGIVTGVSGGTSTISYTLATGCRTTRVVTIIETPAAITGTGTVCAGSTTSLSSATAGGVWSSSTVSIATVNSGTGLVTGVSGGTSTISYAIGSCFTTSVVTVTPLPAAITGSLAICVGNTSTLFSATAGGTWASSDVTKATINSGTGVATGVASGTSTITYTSSGCIATAVVTVSTVPAITGTAVVCQGATTTLAHVTAGGTWSSANGAIATVGSATGVVTGVSAGNVGITYTLTGSCAQNIVVTVNPAPNTISGAPIVCEGATTAFTSSTGGGTWSSSTPAVGTVNSTTGVFRGLVAGTSTVTYQLGTGCSTTRIVTVSAAPGAITGTATVCAGSTTALGATPGSGVWSSSNLSKATIDAGTGVATGVAAGTSSISYTIGSCRSTIVLTVLATPGSISGPLLTCIGSTAQLASPTFSGAWSSTDVTKATIHPSSGLVTGVALGTTTISYVVGGCARTAVVTVNAAVGAITGTPLVCVGQNIATLVGPGGGTWASSNTSIATVHSITALLTGIGTGNATITYRTSAGCYSTIQSTVNAAVANITGTLSVCEEGSTTALANATGGGVWSSTNTAKATVNPATGLVTGVDFGTSTISYVLSAGCYKAATVVVNLRPTPFDGLSMTVTETDTIHISSIAGGVWASDHPAFATVAPGDPGIGIVTGVSPGAATIRYTFATGCERTGVITVVSLRPGGNNNGTVNISTELKVYPNPTSGILTIDAPVSGTFKVYTIDGKEVANFAVTAKANVVSLPSNLATGIYMCRFSGADGTSAIIRLVFEQ